MAEGGQAIVLVAISLLAMLMVVGLAVDAGQLYSARRAMQEAADAATYAGAVVLYQGGTWTDAQNAAIADAARNGYTITATDVTVPTTAPFNTTKYLQVVITQQVRTSLVPAEAGLTSVTVRSIAGAEPLNNQYAIIALDRGATQQAFNAAGAQITLTGGGIHVNSTYGTGNGAAKSTSNTWSVSCPSTNPCAIDVTGTTTGTWPASSPGSPNYFNGLRTGQAQIPDPFAGYPKPSTSGMALNPAGFGPGGNTLGAGIYTSIISNKNLCHGIYILKGAGIAGGIDSDTTSTDPATGLRCDGKVMIFNTMSNYPASGGTCTGVNLNGNHDISLNAMTTGTYAGMLFYQDPSCTAQMSIGSSSLEIDATNGTIYLPTAALVVTGGHPEIGGGQIVAKTVDLGGAQVDINFSAATSAQPTLPRLAK